MGSFNFCVPSMDSNQLWLAAICGLRSTQLSLCFLTIMKLKLKSERGERGTERSHAFVGGSRGEK